MTRASFTGGGKLDAYLREVAKKVTAPGVLEVGFLEGATYPDGTSVPMVAAIQEFGAPGAGIPPRPFFRTMIAAKASGWGPALAKILDANGYDGTNALGQMGEGIAGQLRQSIIDVVAPPLSPVTLMLRSMRAENPDLQITGKIVAEAAARVAAKAPTANVSSKPLVDTGHLLNSVDYEVTPG